ncbi:MAG: hypothetical protein Ct9H300mP30_1690 [Methanobacteriota archaeon]|nr:MAG: hypothetical protein Ct9H300mP30_1690 [Euryarchaeota archaeon]
MIDQVYMGHVLQTGAGQAPARQVAMNAGLPVSTPCTAINKVCGSSLKAAMIAATEITAGISSLVVAGGMESMRTRPISSEVPGGVRTCHTPLWSRFWSTTV